MGCCASVDNASASRDAQTSSATKIPGILDYTGQGLVGVPPIPSSMQVSTLLLQNNFLTTLPPTLSLQTLTELDLSSNRFVRVPEVLRKQSSLTSLNISNNPLSRTGGYEELPHISSLKTLKMAMCSIRKVPPAMARCTNIVSLDLSYNHFIDLSGPELPALTKLEELNISNCTLKDSLPTGVVNNTSITHLNISFNAFTLSGPHAFGPNLEGNLAILHCSGMGMAVVPQSIVNLRGLKELHLAKNKGVDLKNFKEMFAKASKKASDSGGTSANSDITASSNSDVFKGTVSTASSLQTLNISDCELECLPDGIDGVAPTLTSLDISYNENIEIMELSGLLPGLKKLSVLGCRFALKGDGRDHEWFELAKLEALEDIEWNIWGESKRFTGFTSNPYSTKFPFQLCALKLQRMNCMTVRPDLFTGDRVQALQQILRDGYYKVDFLFEPMAIAAHHHIMEMLHPKAVTILEACANSPLLECVLKQRYCFFLFLQALHPESVLLPPLEIVVVHYAHMCIDPVSYRRLGMRLFSHIVDNNYRLTLVDDIEGGDLSRYSAFWDTEVSHLEESRKVELDWLRYNVFSAGTSLNSSANGGAPSVPKANRAGRAVADSTSASPTSVSFEAPLVPNGSVPNPFLPKSQGGSLELLDAIKVSDPSDVLDVLGLLDPGSVRQVKLNLVTMLQDFASYAKHVVMKQDSLERVGGEAWLRYAKYLSICARNPVSCHDGSTEDMRFEEKSSDPPTPHLTDPMAPENFENRVSASPSPRPDTAPGTSASTLEAGSEVPPSTNTEGSSDSRDENNHDVVGTTKPSAPATDAEPSSVEQSGVLASNGGSPSLCAPTFTIKDVLYLHRTTPIKYNSTMSFLGVDFSNVENKVNTPHKVSEMNIKWESLFDEPYMAKQGSAIGFEDDALASLQPSTSGALQSSGTGGNAGGVQFQDSASPSSSAGPHLTPSILSPTASSNEMKVRKKRRVTLATLDVQ